MRTGFVVVCPRSMVARSAWLDDDSEYTRQYRELRERGQKILAARFFEAHKHKIVRRE
jgi:hypothetical protein